MTGDHSADTHESAHQYAIGRLLTETAWRQRAVEQVMPRSAGHYELRRSLQLEVPTDLFGDHEVPTGQLLLPVWWLPKLPLLRFSVEDQHGLPLAVLPRREAAGVLGRVLFERLPTPTEDWAALLSLETLVATAVSSLAPWIQIADKSVSHADAAIDYVEIGAGQRLLPVDAARHLERGRDLTLAAYRACGMEARWSSRERDNTALNGLLLVAYVDPRLASCSAVSEWIDTHHSTIEKLVIAAGSDQGAMEFLSLLTLAGVRWPAIVPMGLAPGDVTVLKTSELRPSGHERTRVFLHETETAYATSYHLQVHSPDNTVVIKKVRAFNGADESAHSEVGFPDNFEFVRQTDELFTAYAGDAERANRIGVRIRFGLRHHVLAVYAFALTLMTAALAGVALVRPFASEAAVLLTLPTSFVTAVVLLRESSLPARFVDIPRYVLLGGTLILWLVAIWRLLGYGWLGGA